jgi:KDO2-lipid IV(A) lauroyltransferase
MKEEGMPVVAVAERLRPERLFDLFLQTRRALGMEVVGLSAEGKVGQQLATALANARVVALVADRDLTGRGLDVEMFGAPRKLPAGPAMLSLSTGAPVIVADTSQTRNGWRCVFGAPLSIEPTGNRREDVTELTRRIAAEFERAIAAAPDDWHMFQPAWED